MIAVRGLTKRYGSTVAVEDLTFTTKSGRITGFLGPNGAGKTTTLRIVLGLASPTAGEATVGGRPYAKLESPAQTVGAVFEASAYHPSRSGRNHLRVLAAAAGLPDSRVDTLLDRVGLGPAARRRVGTYSLGMRQRLSVAGALLGDPELLVLDEPANGLDPEGIRWLRGLLRDFTTAGGTILVSSHVLAEVQQLADDVVIIDRGRLVAHESLAQLTAQAAGGTRVRSPQAEELRRALEAVGLEVTVLDPSRLAVLAAPDQVGEIAAATGIVLHELAPATATLEEVFLRLTQETS